MTALLESQGFWIASGASFAVVVALISVHALTGRWWGGAGIVATVGALVGMAVELSVPIELVGGVVLLGGAAEIGARWSRLAGAVAVVPGAVLVGAAVHAAVPARDWVAVVVGAAAGIAAATVADFEDDQPRLVGVCLAISAAGVYAAVPDTEAARALLGAAAVGALMGLAPNARGAPAGSAAALGTLCWTVGVGGWARPGALVAGIGCIGILALGFVVRWMRTPTVAIIAVQVGLVAVVARVAGLREGAGAALAIVVVTYVLALLALWAAGRLRPTPLPDAR